MFELLFTACEIATLISQKHLELNEKSKAKEWAERAITVFDEAAGTAVRSVTQPLYLATPQTFL
jgi:hypothetical protein